MMLMDIGVMVGSSADGLDVVGVDIDENNINVKFHQHCPFTDTIQTELKAIVDNLSTVDVEKIKAVESQLTYFVIKSLQSLNLNWEKVRQISFHGYTVCHYPQYGLSWQLGDPQLIADQLGCIVIHDFRQEIIENGGVGAPLVPNFHHWLTKILNIPKKNFINIGGICNISIINGFETWGTDIGPGNCLSDHITKFFFNKPFDKDGILALSGSCDDQTYHIIEGFYNLRIPAVKNMQPENRFSLTRQDFELDTLMRKLVRTQVSPCDILTTSHHYVADRINEVVKCSETRNVEFFGGGVLNTSLMNIITKKLGNYNISHSQWHPQIMEGLAFAWLGYQRIHNKKHSRHMIGTSTDLFLGTIVGPETNSYCVSENKVTKLKKIFL